MSPLYYENKKKLKRAVWAKTGGICHLCDGEIDGIKYMTFDHIIPVVNGGLLVEENLLPAHQVCNGIRGSEDICNPENYKMIKLIVKNAIEAAIQKELKKKATLNSLPKFRGT